ncbi:hypothetical protein JCM3770_003566 [Rhodotorula araucariae]
MQPAHLATQNQPSPAPPLIADAAAAQSPRAQPAATNAARAKNVKAEDHYPSPPQAPPTPAATTSSPGSFSIPLPSFVHEDPLSSDPDSSSDEDSFGEAKPARPTRFSKSTGLPRPKPSYYYDAEYDPGTAGTKKRGRRGGYKGVPVFEPTMEDFAGHGGFYGYVKRIEKYGLRSGIVKVVPPKEWSASLPPVDKPLRSIRLRDAIEQHMLGSQGLYRVMNEAKARVWNAAQWKDLATREKWQAPDLVGDEKKGERSERAVISDRAKRLRAGRDKEVRKGKGKGKAKAEEDAEEADEEDADEDAADEYDAAPGSSKRRTPARRAKVDGAAKAAAGKGKGKAPVAVPVEADDEPEAPAKKRRSSAVPSTPSDEEWAVFVAGLPELPHGMTREDYTVERMRDFERRYWRTLTFGEPPMYGADMAGSLFDDSTTAWNVAHLGDLLPKLAPRGCEIPGVVTPYLYFGMWRATFAWHVEDADLYSINYIHFGAPKFWYSVPQEQSERFERVMAGLFPTDRAKCSQFLRHKSFLASPKILSNNGITLNRCVQLPGEFILTYPKGYHSGFNLGFNCAESINFATERWLPLGKVTKHCRCIEDSVNIDVTTWLRQAAKDEHLDRGDPWPYDELEEQALLALIEAEDRAEAEREKAAAAAAAALARKRASTSAASSDRPAKKTKQAAYQVPMVLMPAVPGVPPAGPLYTLSILQALQSNDVLPEIKGQLAQLIQHPSGTWRLETPVRFQVVPHPNPPPPPPPVPRTKPEPNPYSTQAFHYPKQVVQTKPLGAASSASSVSAPTMHRFPAPTAVGAPAPPPKPDFACALCPDMSTEGLVMIGEPGVRSTKKRMDAHRVCVMFTPATWIEIDPDSGEEIVRGFAKIEKARWKLKCQLCAEAHGTKVQCTKGKCTKAFHVTCALRDDAGIHMDATIPDGEGTGGAISILEQTRATTPPPLAPPPVEPVQSQRQQQQAPMPPMSPSKVVPDNDQIHLTVLCRTHNPDWQRRETERKAAELREKVDALTVGDRIRVRTNGGVYDVQFEGTNIAEESVAYAFEDGKRSYIKWKNIVWPDSPEKQRKKEEAAARAEREKLAILDRPAYRAPASAKRASGGTTPVPAAPTQSAPPSHELARQPYYGVPQPAASGMESSPYAQMPQGYPVYPPPRGYHPQSQAYGYPPQHGAPPPPQAAYGYPPGPPPPPMSQHVGHHGGPPPPPPGYPPAYAYPSAPGANAPPPLHQQRPLPPFSSFAAAQLQASPPPPQSPPAAPQPL